MVSLSRSRTKTAVLAVPSALLLAQIKTVPKGRSAFLRLQSGALLLLAAIVFVSRTALCVVVLVLVALLALVIPRWKESAGAEYLSASGDICRLSPCPKCIPATAYCTDRAQKCARPACPVGQEIYQLEETIHVDQKTQQPCYMSGCFGCRPCLSCPQPSCPAVRCRNPECEFFFVDALFSYL